MQNYTCVQNSIPHYLAPKTDTLSGVIIKAVHCVVLTLSIHYHGLTRMMFSEGAC